MAVLLLFDVCKFIEIIASLLSLITTSYQGSLSITLSTKEKRDWMKAAVLLFVVCKFIEILASL